ncbi:MAG: LPS assembly lipoprotein LptE [bacterium]
MTKTKLLVIPILLLMLSACGFTPIYAERDSGVLSGMAAIELHPVLTPEKASFIFQSEMTDRLQATGTPRFDLEVELKERRVSLAVTRSEDTIRYSYELTAKYKITDRITGQTYNNEKSAASSYGIVSSQYASLIGEEDAIRKATLSLIDQIELDLILYMKNREQAGGR